MGDAQVDEWFDNWQREFTLAVERARRSAVRDIERSNQLLALSRKKRIVRSRMLKYGRTHSMTASRD